MIDSDSTLIELVYLSCRGGIDDQAVVDDIVLPAMRFNRAHAITGCLWIGKEHFVQVLEGPEARVAPLFQRIEKDPRHDSVELVERAPIVTRQHTRYAMQMIRGAEHEEIARVIQKWTDGHIEPEQVNDCGDDKPTPIVRLTDRLSRMLVGRKAF